MNSVMHRKYISRRLHFHLKYRKLLGFLAAGIKSLCSVEHADKVPGHLESRTNQRGGSKFHAVQTHKGLSL